MEHDFCRNQFFLHYHKAPDEKEAKEIHDILLNHAKDFRDQLDKKMKVSKIKVTIFCPFCRGQHIDEGKYAIKPHKVHLCFHCGKKIQSY